MKHFVSIVEIPTTDFSRAVQFYQSLLQIQIEEVDMGELRMGVFPGEEGAVNVTLLHGKDYRPAEHGVVVYLNAGDDLQPLLDGVETYGGKIVVPKTEIDPEMGFFALFQDTEGNTLGLYSAR
jgi:predicted enzyme related to lactoylglutathione lyase